MMYGIHKLQLQILHGIELFWNFLTSRGWTICKYKNCLVSLVVVHVAIYHILWCTHGMAQLELPRSHMGKTNFACLTCSYVVGQCSIPYSVCGLVASSCFNLYIMGSGRWPLGPVWVIADVPYTCTLFIIDLQVNVKIIHIFTASVRVLALAAPFRAS